MEEGLTYEDLVKYAEAVGGVFSFENIEAIPFNHWKRDMEWAVLVINPPYPSAFFLIRALSPREACHLALIKYLKLEEEDE